ncbi:hypothetical protein AB1A64_11790 [Ruegeria sp. ANG10]|uniref:hypothetical protein n=1 Tax=Ruegeria sp. ANG10 TaxID=3042467 RepID=UPI003451A55A
MRHKLAVYFLPVSFACQALAENSPVPVDVLAWFEGCTQLTQPANGMFMDTNCADLAIQYCVIGRARDKQQQCFVEFSKQVSLLSGKIRDDLPLSINGTTWRARGYERTYRQLVEDVFDVCDSSPVADISPDVWCDAYLKTGEWLQWRSLERIADEVQQ